MKTTREKYQTRQAFLGNEMNREAAILIIKNAPLDPFRPLEVLVREQVKKRSLDQNAKFHAICNHVAKSGHKFAGKAREDYEWKVIFVSGHSVATKSWSEVIPGIEGEFVNIRESTSKMDKSRASSLIEYCIAYCLENGIMLPYFDEG
ncbi:recombination protein NinB [Methylobacillus sp.]|uniref:recombination protein NinB n=1 Tax=Methylobacillus sp. TaxID=56818 RepID=UPI002FE36177